MASRSLPLYTIRALFADQPHGFKTTVANKYGISRPALSLWIHHGVGPESVRVACETEARRLMKAKA